MPEPSGRPAYRFVKTWVSPYKKALWGEGFCRKPFSKTAQKIDCLVQNQQEFHFFHEKTVKKVTFLTV